MPKVGTDFIKVSLFLRILFYGFFQVGLSPATNIIKGRPIFFASASNVGYRGLMA